jgi:transporter family protein
LIGGAIPAICLLAGAVAFSEWRNLDLSLVALGALLICVGATVVSLSRRRMFHDAA